MNNLLMLWLSLSLSASFVTLAIVLLKPILRHFSKTWNFYLWLLVILRLLVPFSPDTSMIGSLFKEAEIQLAAQIPLTENKTDANTLNPDESSDMPALEPGTSPETPTFYPVRFFMESQLLGIVWLAVALFLILRKGFAYRQFVSAVRRESRHITDGKLPDILRQMCSSMGIKKKIVVCSNPLIKAPMLLGVFKPAIILPSETIAESELAYIFRHELTHYRRMDFLYKWLTEIAVSLHWFNPVIYWVRRQINRDCELSCDETVISLSNEKERRTYGDTLLNSITLNKKGTINIVSLSLNEDGQLLKERLDGIMKYQRKSKLIVFFATLLTSALFCGTVFAGAYTGKVIKKVNNISTDTATNLIQISGKSLASGEKISLGSKNLSANITYQALLIWTGDEHLTVLCTSSDGEQKSYPIENGKTTTFGVDADGEYTIAIKNEGNNTIEKIKGSVFYEKNVTDQGSHNANVPAQTNTSAQSVVFESTEIRWYTGEGRHPYIHDIMTNNTTKEITGCQRGMLAFDKDGNPLKIDWWGVDTELDYSYFYLYEDDLMELASGKTDDVRGGWSLVNFDEAIKGASVNQIGYVLYCNKEITFADGTTWKNPEFETWLSTYEGNKIDVNVLKNYYPYEQTITF